MHRTLHPASAFLSVFFLSISASAYSYSYYNILKQSFELSDPLVFSSSRAIEQSKDIKIINKITMSPTKGAYNFSVGSRYINQLEGESLDDFLSKVQSESENCEVASVHDRLVIFRMIVGVRNDIFRELISTADLTLERVTNMCRESEKIISYVNGDIPEIQLINDDCLRQIFENLNYMDGVNLSKTCRRLMNFANSDYFPRKTRQIRIDINKKAIVLKGSSVKAFKSGLTLHSLESEFNYFQQFVEDLTINLQYLASPIENDLIWHYTDNITERCKHLKSLRFESWYFTSNQTAELQSHIRGLPNLKELHLWQCSGITKNWRADSRATLKIEKLTIRTAEDEIYGNFIDYFRNLFSLTIEIQNRNTLQIEDIAKIFDYNCQSLKHLKLLGLDHVNGYESVGRIIAEKLPKLESLGLGFTITDNSKYMTELPHLKSLELNGVDSLSLLRTLSDNGIEELTINDEYFFANIAENGPPLIFNKLQSLRLTVNATRLLEIITESRMPEIHTFVLHHINYQLRGEYQIPKNELLKFVETNKTLKFFRIFFMRDAQCSTDFIRKIIDILKVPCTPKRPFLNMELGRIYLEPEAVSQIAPVKLTIQ